MTFTSPPHPTPAFRFELSSPVVRRGPTFDAIDFLTTAIAIIDATTLRLHPHVGPVSMWMPPIGPGTSATVGLTFSALNRTAGLPTALVVDGRPEQNPTCGLYRLWLSFADDRCEPLLVQSRDDLARWIDRHLTPGEKLCILRSSRSELRWVAGFVGVQFDEPTTYQRGVIRLPKPIPSTPIPEPTTENLPIPIPAPIGLTPPPSSAPSSRSFDDLFGNVNDANEYKISSSQSSSTGTPSSSASSASSYVRAGGLESDSGSLFSSSDSSSDYLLDPIQVRDLPANSLSIIAYPAQLSYPGDSSKR